MFYENIYVYERIYNNNYYTSVETLNGSCRLMRACHIFFLQARTYITTSEGFYEITVTNLSKLFSFK